MNCIDQNIKSFTLWIKYSAKREDLLKAIIGMVRNPKLAQTRLQYLMFVLLDGLRILMVGKDSHSITTFLLNFVNWLYMVIVNFVNLMMAGLQKTRRMLLHI